MMMTQLVKFPEASRRPGVSFSGDEQVIEQYAPSALQSSTYPVMNHIRPPKHHPQPTRKPETPSSNGWSVWKQITIYWTNRPAVAIICRINPNWNHVMNYVVMF